jgi:hypothetical protein
VVAPAHRSGPGGLGRDLLRTRRGRSAYPRGDRPVLTGTGPIADRPASSPLARLSRFVGSSAEMAGAPRWTSPQGSLGPSHVNRSIGSWAEPSGTASVSITPVRATGMSKPPDAGDGHGLGTSAGPYEDLDAFLIRADELPTAFGGNHRHENLDSITRPGVARAAISRRSSAPWSRSRGSARRSAVELTSWRSYTPCGTPVGAENLPRA